MKFYSKIIILFLLVAGFIVPNTLVAQQDTLALVQKKFDSRYKQNLNAIKIYRQAYDKFINQAYEEALPLLDMAVQQKPFFPEAYFTRGSVREQLDNLAGALTDYETVVRQEENHQEALFKIAVIHQKIGNHSACISTIDKLLDMPVLSTNAVFFKMEAPSGGITEIVSLHSQKADLYHLRGNSYKAMGMYPKAIADMEKALEFNERDPDLYVSLGLIYLELNQKGKAWQAFTEALKTDPWHKQALYNLVLIDESKEKEVLLESYTAAIGKNIQMAEAYVNRGVIYFEKNDCRRAKADFDSAALLKPSDPEILLNKGITNEKLNLHKQAIKDFQKALQYGADAAKVNNNLANVYFKIKEYANAEQFYTLALHQDPELIHCYYNRGLCRYKINKPEEACQDLHKANHYGIAQAQKAVIRYCADHPAKQ